jgi:hypothetical protein
MFPLIIKNILTNNDLYKIIYYINSNIKDFGDLNTDNYWSGRTLFYNSIKDKSVKTLILSSLKYGIVNLPQYTDKTLYCEHLSIARWPTGYSLQPHADAENPKECGPHPYPWRHFACITFLNDNFDGGVLYFPNQGIEISPKPGITIIFPGSLEYLHGITEITSGNRYTIASFLTYDATKSSINLS